MTIHNKYNVFAHFPFNEMGDVTTAEMLTEHLDTYITPEAVGTWRQRQSVPDRFFYKIDKIVRGMHNTLLFYDRKKKFIE